jgi:DNA-binding MarR family transcriptional regulator
MKTNSDKFVWPGHLIRRLQQMAVLVFHQETADLGVTPTQFITLLAIEDQPGLDQVRLSQVTKIDRSMTARIVETLALRSLIRKQPGKTDKRANALFLAAKGAQLLKAAVPGVDKSQKEILNPLSQAERKEFTRMVLAVLEAHENTMSDDEAAALSGDEAAVKPRRKRVRKP